MARSLLDIARCWPTGFLALRLAFRGTHPSCCVLRPAYFGIEPIRSSYRLQSGRSKRWTTQPGINWRVTVSSSFVAAENHPSRLRLDQEADREARAGRRLCPAAGSRSALVVASTMLLSLAPLEGIGATGDTGADTSAGIEEITVTARRRSESVQDVPLPVSTLDGDRLDESAAFNVGRLQSLQPSLQFYSSNPRNTAVNLRGFGAPFGLTNDGIEQGVGLYVDQVYYSRIAASTFDFLDVEQVEVLRGPQGTLYGKNTTAGALNITSRAPSFEPETRVDVSGGSLGYAQLRGSWSAPVIEDRVAVRLAASLTRRDGIYENVSNGREVNETDNIGVRGQVLWVATDNLDLTLAADFSRQDPECCALVYADAAPTLRALNRQYRALANASGYVEPSSDAFDRKLRADTELSAKQEFGGASLRAEWDLGFGDLTSVTAWRKWDWYPSNDRDFTGLPITTISANPSKQRQCTQEFRIASSVSDTFDYVVGVFGFHQTIKSTGIQEQGSSATLWLLGPTQNAATPSLLTGLRQDTDISYTNDSVAVFGQVGWSVTDTVKLQGGLRYNYDRKEADYDAVASGGLATTNANLIRLKNSILQSQSYLADFDDQNISGDINLSWRPLDEVMVYALYAQTFKSGGVNLSGIPARADGSPALETASVDPEKVRHYEVGVKSDWLEGRLVANVSAFRTDVEDYQTTVISGAVGVLRGYLANAEEVRSQGFEFEVQALPIESLRLNLGIAYTDATYRDFVSAPPPVELSGGAVSFVDISGERLPGVSKWAITAGGEYAKRLGREAAGEFFVGGDVYYRSKWSSNPSPSDYMWVDGHTLVNLRGGYRADAGWTVTVWGRNIADEEYFDFLSAQSGSTGMIAGQPGEPRTYGVTYAIAF